MKKFIKIYLVTTGILAFLALGFPNLIIYGLFLLIVPGLILLWAPTAFMWGCMLALAYWLAGKVARPPVAAALAVVTTTVLLWAIPQPSVLMATETLSQYDLADVTPTAPIQPRGDIRIDGHRSNWDSINQKKLGFRAHSCDDRCLALLFEPEVRSVTMTLTSAPTYEAIRDGESAPDGNSLTYRLLAKEQCGDRSLDPDLKHRSGHFGETIKDQRAMVADWGLQLTDRYCLIGDPPLDRFDMLIRSGTFRPSPGEEPQFTRWSLSSRGTAVDYEEIRDGEGNILFRRYDLSTQALSAPLAVAGNSDSSLQVYWGWATRILPSGSPRTGEKPSVDTVLAVRRTLDPQVGLAAARSALRTALALPSGASTTDASQLIGNYMEILAETEASPADVNLVADLLASPRVDDLPGAWVLTRKFSPDQLVDLLPATVHKLATAPDTASPRSSLGEYLEMWPQGAFAKLNQDMRDLLADPIRRRRATGLIARLSDMGPSAAPVVADIMVWHADAISNLKNRDKTLPSGQVRQTLEDHMAVIDAGRRAMCRLGGQAAAHLPQMLEVEQHISVRSDERRSWDAMMVRLGKPVGEVESPSARSDEDYQESVKRYAEWEDESVCK